MKEKLAVFDLDGTLFDTKIVNFYAYKEAVNEFGHDIEYDYFCGFCNGKHYLEFLPLIINNDESIIKKIHDRKKILYKDYLNKAIKNEHLFEIIKTLKNTYFIAVVTTATKENCHDILNFFNVFDEFDIVLTSEDVENVKPDPEGFLKVIDYFGVKKENTIIFEDSTVGIQAAKNSGANYMIVCGYN